MNIELKPLKLDVSAQAAAYLQRQHMTPEDYSTEVLRNHLELLALGELGKIENRPDWQEAIQQGRAEIRAGLGIADDEIGEWLKSQHD